MNQPEKYVIQTQGLSKSFGEVQALTRVDLKVPHHSIFGFLGPNGAGKTTLMKILLGLAHPTHGSGTIFGHDIVTESVATQPSVASMAIVAHELGHAQQHENNSVLISMRNFLIPAVNFSSPLSYICILFGFLFNLPGLVGLGILFFAIMVLFTIVTLPVEFDASRRGLKLLDQSDLMRTEADEKGSQQVLRAAALTYVAAAVTAVLQLMYYLRLAGRGRR